MQNHFNLPLFSNDFFKKIILFLKPQTFIFYFPTLLNYCFFYVVQTKPMLLVFEMEIHLDVDVEVAGRIP